MPSPPPSSLAAGYRCGSLVPSQCSTGCQKGNGQSHAVIYTHPLPNWEPQRAWTKSQYLRVRDGYLVAASLLVPVPNDGKEPALRQKTKF